MFKILLKIKFEGFGFSRISTCPKKRWNYFVVAVVAAAVVIVAVAVAVVVAVVVVVVVVADFDVFKSMAFFQVPCLFDL